MTVPLVEVQFAEKRIKRTSERDRDRDRERKRERERERGRCKIQR